MVNTLFMVTVHHCMLSCSYSNNIFSFFFYSYGEMSSIRIKAVKNIFSLFQKHD